jgi:hypothetical protein
MLKTVVLFFKYKLLLLLLLGHLVVLLLQFLAVLFYQFLHLATMLRLCSPRQAKRSWCGGGDQECASAQIKRADGIIINDYITLKRRLARPSRMSVSQVRLAIRRVRTDLTASRAS